MAADQPELLREQVMELLERQGKVLVEATVMVQALTQTFNAQRAAVVLAALGKTDLIQQREMEELVSHQALLE